MKKLLILFLISFTFLTPTIVLAGATPTNPGEGTQEPKDEPVDPGEKPGKPDNN